MNCNFIGQMCLHVAVVIIHSNLIGVFECCVDCLKMKYIDSNVSSVSEIKII